MPEYKIIGCALSDLSPDATPFAVIVMAQEQGRSELASWVLLDWNVRADRFPPCVCEAMQEFITDLRSFEPGDETERFFLYLGTLGTGIIRLLKEGTHNGAAADDEVALFFHENPCTIHWPASFARL